MSFKKLSLKDYYNNDEDDLIEDFYNPVISNAKIYKRSTGFFSSSSFWKIIDGLKIFVKQKGKINLIVSPNISTKDIEAIIIGEEAKAETINGFIISRIINEKKYIDQFNLLAWLISQDKLEIKFIVKKRMDRYGIFHDKTAILYDENGDKIAFHGSINESETAYNDNFESFDLFKSWIDNDLIRINNLERTFDRIWNNNSNKWEAYSIPLSIKKQIIEKRTVNIIKSKNKQITIPKNCELRDYQRKAITSWMQNSFSGILEMATGSGKTFTAIFAICKLIDLINKKGYPCAVVIVVPYKNLLEQWCEQLEKFNINPVKCYCDKISWYYNLKNSIIDFNNGKLNNLFIIATNYTFCSYDFQTDLYLICRDYILCADEVHHLMSPKISRLLPENTKFRLGLTATMCNEYEKEKEDILIRYFNKITYRYTLEDAINDGYLTKYYYYPVFIELTLDEREEYIKLTKQLARLLNSKEDIEVSLECIRNKRRRIILNASNKIMKFQTMKEELKKHNRTLVYCGDKIDDEGKFIDKINKMIYEMGIRTHTYSSELDNKTRIDVLNKFGNGELNVLTAIKCLDEGVDIPEIECAFILASNLDSKQFIQRRGRILRKAKGKEYAYIYDFVVVPLLDKKQVNYISEYEKKIYKNIFNTELKRVFEFAKLSLNINRTISQITDVMEMYGED